MTQPNTKCRIWWNTDIDSYQITVAYSPQFLTILKQLIPVSDRGYDEETKIWVFSERFFTAVKKLAEATWPNAGEVHIIDRATSERSKATPSVQKAPIGDICQEFMKLLPYDAALTAYRKGAAILHPDRGGSMESMSRLNVLWTRLSKEVYKQ